MSHVKEKKWFKPLFDFDEQDTPKKSKKTNPSKSKTTPVEDLQSVPTKDSIVKHNINSKFWMRNFNPVKVEELAVHIKKVNEVEEWVKTTCGQSHPAMLLLTGPVGCGKTITIWTIANKHKVKLSEWITPMDIDIPSEYGDFEYKVKQSTKFLEFIINAANFTSLLDANSNKLVVVEDFPNTFMRTPSEFTDVLQLYKQRAKSPIVFICSESNTDNKNSAFNLFNAGMKEQFNMQHVTFNSVSLTGLKSALKRVADIISNNYKDVYNVPTSDLIDCVANSSGGDVRSAVLNLHFASLKGSNCNLETSIIDKEVKNKPTRKKKQASSKFLSIGKDDTVSILHGVGRVLNPKVVVNEKGIEKLVHSPKDITEQFLSQPSSFLNFLGENYLSHFSCIHQTEKAAAALSDADYMLAEWREKMCQEFGLYVSIAGLILSNKSPVSSWNPVRGPKNMKIKYPTLQDLPMLEPNQLYKGKVLVTDYQSYCKIIGYKSEPVTIEEFDL